MIKSPQMDFKLIFKQIGLSESSAEVYRVLLENGKLTILQVANKTDIPRSSCYEYLPELIAKGLIIESREGKTRLYHAASPRKLNNLLQQHLEQIKEQADALSVNLEELEKAHVRNLREPKVFYLSGGAKILTLLREILTVKKELLVFSKSGDMNVGLDLSDSYFEGFLEKFHKAGIHCREICNYNMNAFNYKQQSQTDLHQIELVRFPDRTLIEEVKFIWEDNFVLLDFARKLIFRINDRKFTESLREQFELIWGVASRIS